MLEGRLTPQSMSDLAQARIPLPRPFRPSDGALLLLEVVMTTNVADGVYGNALKAIASASREAAFFSYVSADHDRDAASNVVDGLVAPVCSYGVVIGALNCPLEDGREVGL